MIGSIEQGVGVGGRSNNVGVPRMQTMAPYSLPPQLQFQHQDFLSHMRTLRNITNNTDIRQIRPPQANKVQNTSFVSLVYMCKTIVFQFWKSHSLHFVKTLTMPLLTINNSFKINKATKSNLCFP